MIYQDDGTFLFISEADGRLKRCVMEDGHCTMEHWEPWRDPRTWWEIVEKLEADEHLFDMRSHPDGTKEAAFHRMKLPRNTFRATAKEPGEAVMLAALAAKETNNGS